MDLSERYEVRAVVRLLPNAPLSDDTELAFIGGRAFVNAAKHGEVVDRHVANYRGAVEAGAALYAALRDGHSLGDEAVHDAMARWEALNPQPPGGQ